MSERLTTPGALLLKHNMPTQEAKESFDVYRPLDKSGVKDMVSMLMQKGGPNAFEHINALGKQFFHKATEIGASTPLSDYINDTEERQAIIKEFAYKVYKIMTGPGTKAEKNTALRNLTGDYNDKIAKQNLDYLVAEGSTAAKMAKTGARGNPSQLATGTSTPLMALNLKGELVPVVIKHSFAEGMSPAEQLALSYMGRSSTVMAQSSTSLPGSLFKRLAPSLAQEVVTLDNCHTKNGILIAVSDAKSLVGRFTADSDTLIDGAMVREWKSSGITKVKARSPMTCEAKNGCCQHCYGLWANGKLPEIGTNIGVVAAQSVSEVLTQAMLSTKHRATVGERKGNAYERASNLLNNPAENFKDEAMLSTKNGVVTNVSQDSWGNHLVTIDDVQHKFRNDQAPVVKKGDNVRLGDRISTGVINPRVLVSMRGAGAGRAYMAEELRDIYGKKLDPRHFDVIAKNLLKYSEIVNPGESGLLPGEKVDINTLREHLEAKSKETDLSGAEGKVLARGVLNLTPGTYLDPNHIQDLKDAGIKKVHVSGSGIVAKAIVPGLQTAKLLDPNWVARLSFNKLSESLKDAAAMGHQSAIHSTDPTASYMMGNEFGEGPNGYY